MLAMGLLSGLGVVGLNAWFWQQMHLALPLFLQLLLVLLLSSFNLAVGFFETNRNKREIQNLFGAYVPPAYEIGRDTSELQSRPHFVCCLLLEKKKLIV